MTKSIAPRSFAHRSAAFCKSSGLRTSTAPMPMTLEPDRAVAMSLAAASVFSTFLPTMHASAPRWTRARTWALQIVPAPPVQKTTLFAGVLLVSALLYQIRRSVSVTHWRGRLSRSRSGNLIWEWTLYGWSLDVRIDQGEEGMEVAMGNYGERGWYDVACCLLSPQLWKAAVDYVGSSDQSILISSSGNFSRFYEPHFYCLSGYEPLFWSLLTFCILFCILAKWHIIHVLSWRILRSLIGVMEQIRKCTLGPDGICQMELKHLMD